jgi:hypothetical protein
VSVAAPRLRRIESWCRPRHVWAFGPVGDRLIGLFAILAAISVLIPFPGTNFPPSIALVIMSIAVMEEDGIVLAGGALVGALGLIYTAFVTGARSTSRSPGSGAGSRREAQRVAAVMPPSTTSSVAVT